MLQIWFQLCFKKSQNLSTSPHFIHSRLKLNSSTSAPTRLKLLYLAAEMSNERKELGTSSQEQLDRCLGLQQRIKYLTLTTLTFYFTTLPSKSKSVGKVAKGLVPNKKGTEKTFPAGGPELISICFWDGQLNNRLKWVSQHHSEPCQVNLFSSALDCRQQPASQVAYGIFTYIYIFDVFFRIQFCFCN